jgi:hypothetical protein
VQVVVRSGVSVDWDTWPIEDLFHIPSDDFVAEDGEPCHIIFSAELDAFTSVDAEDLSVLKKRGIRTRDPVPEDCHEP